jgi:1-deoxy-D-xylulose-5-phosphate reductoisomerase
VAVAAFLEGSIRFDEIPRVIEKVLEVTSSAAPESIQKVLEADVEARRIAREHVSVLQKAVRPQATSFA